MTRFISSSVMYLQSHDIVAPQAQLFETAKDRVGSEALFQSLELRWTVGGHFGVQIGVPG